MQFMYDGKFYKVIKITGPSHNILGLSFCDIDENDNKIKVTVLKELNKNTINIMPNEVESQVRQSLNEINQELNMCYKVKEIQFLQSDTPSAKIYKELTALIVKKLANGETFQKAN